jgi:type II secretion system protein D
MLAAAAVALAAGRLAGAPASETPTSPAGGTPTAASAPATGNASVTGGAATSPASAPVSLAPPPAPVLTIAPTPVAVAKTPVAGVPPKEPPVWDPPDAPAPDPKELVGPFILVDESLPQVVSLYEKISGRVVLRMQSLPALKINFNSPARLPRREAVAALENLLVINGVNLAPVPGTNFMKATLAGFAALETPPLYTDADAAELAKLEPSERVIARLYQLRNTMAHPSLPVFVTLNSLINRARGHSLAALAQSNALLLTSSVSTVLRAEKIVAALDAGAEVFYFDVKHVRASELKRLLLTLNTGQAPISWFMAGSFTVEADDLANQLMVVTLPANRARLTELVARFDRENVTLRTLHLKHIRPSDVKRLVAALQVELGAPAPGRPPLTGAAWRNVLRNVMAGDLVLEADDTSGQLFAVTQPANHAKLAELVAQLDKPSVEVRFYDIKFVNAADIKRYFQTLLAGAGGAARPGVPAPRTGIGSLLGGEFIIEANEAANRIMVVARPEGHECAAKIIREMDVNSAELMVFPVRHVKASKIKRVLEALRTGRSQDGTAVAPKPGARADANAVRGLLGGDVTLEADDFANQIVVMAQPQIREKIKTLIGQLDRDAAPATVSEIVGLKHSEVENTIRVLSVIVTGKSGGLLQAEGGRRSADTARGGGIKGGVTTGIASYRTFSFTNRNDTPSANPLLARNSAVSAAGTPNSFSEYVTVSGDERTNRLMLFGTAEDVKQLREIITKLDTPLPQVRIEAVVVEVRLTQGEASGLQTLGIGVTAGGSGYRYSQPTWSGSTAAPVTPGTNTSPFSGTLRLAPDAFDLSVLLGEAERNTRVRILSAPLINTSHNQPASVFVGEEHPVVTSINNYVSTGGTQSSQVEYKQIGLQLNVTPRVGANGSVEMKVDQTNQNISRTVVIDGNEQPVTSTRSASAYLIAGDNETVVLAGLQSYRESESLGVMWLLGKIPLLGLLFQPSTNETERSEIIIFLKPHILTAADAAADTLPGMRPGSLTRDDARGYLDTGRFSAVSLTQPEREALDEVRARQRRNAGEAAREDASRKEARRD